MHNSVICTSIMYATRYIECIIKCQYFNHLKTSFTIAFIRNNYKLKDHNYYVLRGEIQRDISEKMHLLLSERLCSHDGQKPMEYCRKWFGKHVFSFEIRNFQSSEVFKVCFIIISCVFVNICGESFDRCQLIQTYFPWVFLWNLHKKLFYTFNFFLKQHKMFSLCV